MDVYSRPLANFASLKILRVLPSPDSDEAPPFSLQRLISREYHIGEEGVLIGQEKECGVVVPPESGLEEKHLRIKWIPGSLRVDTRRTPPPPPPPNFSKMPSRNGKLSNESQLQGEDATTALTSYFL